MLMTNKKIYFVTDRLSVSINHCAVSLRSLGNVVHIMCANPFNLDTRTPGLVILDYPSMLKSDDGMPKHIERYACNHRVLLINLSQGDIDEMTAIQRGCVGAIYGELSETKLTSAISGALRDELWFSRRNISAALIAALNASSNVQTSNAHEKVQLIKSLTQREKTIVSLVSKGASNKDIANSLYISCHTVKTHIYSAFKKTNSKNRVELTCWAMQHPDITELTA